MLFCNKCKKRTEKECLRCSLPLCDVCGRWTTEKEYPAYDEEGAIQKTSVCKPLCNLTTTIDVDEPPSKKIRPPSAIAALFSTKFA